MRAAANEEEKPQADVIVYADLGSIEEGKEDHWMDVSYDRETGEARVEVSEGVYGDTAQIVVKMDELIKVLITKKLDNPPA